MLYFTIYYIFAILQQLILLHNINGRQISMFSVPSPEFQIDRRGAGIVGWLTFPDIIMNGC